MKILLFSIAALTVQLGPVVADEIKVESALKITVPLEAPATPGETGSVLEFYATENGYISGIDVFVPDRNAGLTQQATSRCYKVCNEETGICRWRGNCGGGTFSIPDVYVSIKPQKVEGAFSYAITSGVINNSVTTGKFDVDKETGRIQFFDEAGAGQSE